MGGRTADQEGWLARTLSGAGDLWTWWTGLSDFHAWQEIGAYLVPALFVLAVIMFWGIRRMHQGH